MTQLRVKLTKDSVERMFSKGGVHPEKRTTYRGFDVFIADGFAANPAVAFKRFGVEPGEFSFGAYCTCWFVAKGEDFFEIGRPMIFDAFHDPDLDTQSKKLARVNRAWDEVKTFLDKRKRYVYSGGLH